MGKTDKRVDAYIDKAEPFAQPILTHLRNLVHQTCPEVEETIKWGFPHFEYKGMMCSMASFKSHCVFGFWKAALMSDQSLLENARSEASMGHLGKITKLKDLPSDRVLIQNIKEAMKLNEQGVKLEKKKPAEVKTLEIPSYFKKALTTDAKAKKTFHSFSPSQQREYIEWIVGAKTKPTREKRIAQALEWLAEGKVRNWKYIRK
jgi:uncharacterized protein YdeI (YjbR/CyaY-like superfamily)